MTEQELIVQKELDKLIVPRIEALEKRVEELEGKKSFEPLPGEVYIYNTTGGE